MPTKTKLLDLNEVADVVVKLAMEKFEKAMKTADNPPLTWDELKDMEGKPVWVEYLRDGATYDAEWCIVKDIDDNLLHDTEGYGYGRANKYGDGYGIGWQAYRRERP